MQSLNKQPTLHVWLDADSAGQRVGYSGSTIRRWARQGLIRYSRVGGRGDYRFLGRWVDDAVEASSVAPEQLQRLPQRSKPKHGNPVKAMKAFAMALEGD